MTTLYLAWQDPFEKLWIPVAKVTKQDSEYTLKYTKGARDSERFTPFGLMKDFDTTYVSEELFPLVSNRLLSKGRPEYETLLKWLDLPKDSDPLDILAITQGQRNTDSLRMIPSPTKEGDTYCYRFFTSGLSHMSESSHERVNNLSPSDKLYLMLDVQNPYDNAIALRTDEPKALVGYCPNYLTEDISQAVKANVEIEITTVKVNPEAPPPYRLLCEAKGKWPKDFRPLSSTMFEPLD